MCTWTDPNHNKQVRIQRRNIVMNKAELIAAMSEKAELSRKDAEKALKAFTDVVT